MRIRRVEAATGIITTVAGNGLQGYSGDGGLAVEAEFSSLGGLAADAAGNLYIADNFNNRIRKVSAATGVITTVAGTGIGGNHADELNNPLDVAVDAAGNLYIADSGNFRLRVVSAATGATATLADGRGYPDRQHGYPCALAIDASGNLYVADFGTSRIRKVSTGMAIHSASDDSEGETVLPGTQQAGKFRINVTFDDSVPPVAQTAFNSLVATYESVFSSSSLTVNVSVTFGETGLGGSDTQQIGKRTAPGAPR